MNAALFSHVDLMMMFLFSPATTNFLYEREEEISKSRVILSLNYNMLIIFLLGSR